MKLLMVVVSVFWGFSSGLVISTGILAFINAVGIIPRLATKSKVATHYYALANASLLGVIVGTIGYLWEVYIPLPKVIIGLFGLASGIFAGCLSMALAEILNVLPITKERIKLKRGLHIAILCFGIGKMIGTLFYYLYPGFF